LIFSCGNPISLLILGSCQYALNIEQFDAAKQLREKLAEVRNDLTSKVTEFLGWDLSKESCFVD
jgi:hypothetical protein